MDSLVVCREDVKEKISSLRTSKSDSKLVYALSFVESVNDEILDISHKFFRIGFYLNEALNNKYYSELGFDNISDCAEYYFGFKKTTTYSLINLFKSFCDTQGTWFLPERWKDYSQSQLAVISTVDYYPLKFRDMVSPFDTVSEIKKAKYYWNMVKKGELSSTYIYDNRCKSAKEFVLICDKKIKDISKEVKCLIYESQDTPQKEEIPDVFLESDSFTPAFSERSENSFIDDVSFYDNLLNLFSDFLIDKSVFPEADQFFHEFTADFLILFKNYLTENMDAFLKFLKSDSTYLRR